MLEWYTITDLERLVERGRNVSQAEDRARDEMLQGTLDMLILRTLIPGPAHGHTIARIIEQTSDEVLQVEQGSLYPALHRLEDRGWLASHWGNSENNRKAKFYKLTEAGRKQLVKETSRWRRMVEAIGRVLGEVEK
jgi:PadR family transcriptional regulator, regulatory protein PadR